MEDIEVTLGEGKRVSARVGKHVVLTDQPQAEGGADEAPGPFDLFLASLATCAGFYVLAFCRARDLPCQGVRLRQHVELCPETHLPARIALTIEIPDDFPAKYRPGLLRAAESCKVKRSLASPPAWEVALTVSPRG